MFFSTFSVANHTDLASIECSQETGERRRAVAALIGLGYTTCALGEYKASGRHMRAALQTAMEIGALWLVTDSLVGIAKLLTVRDLDETTAEKAVELLAFVLAHPSCSQETRNLAIPLLEELESRLLPVVVEAAKGRSQEHKLQSIVEESLKRASLPCKNFGDG